MYSRTKTSLFVVHLLFARCSVVVQSATEQRLNNERTTAGCIILQANTIKHWTWRY